MAFLEVKSEGDERPVERFTWSQNADGTLRWALETLDDDGTTWKPDVVARFTRE